MFIKNYSSFIATLSGVVLFVGCSAGIETYSPRRNMPKNEIVFQFKKGLLPNSYYLKIDNRSNHRSVEFYGCYHATPTETNYYVLTQDGSKYYFDSNSFCGIGAKGRYWVNPGYKGSLAFKIEKKIVQNGKKIFFKGVTYIQRMEGHFMHLDDMSEIIITYDNASASISAEDGKKIVPEQNINDIFINGIKDLNTDKKGDEFEYKRLRLEGDNHYVDRPEKIQLK